MDQPERLGFLVGEGLRRGLVEERLLDRKEEKLLDWEEVSLMRV